ncbi:MAG: HD domain-containing protein [Promethearchaeota archaeon]
MTDRQLALIEEFALKKYRSLDDTHGADHCEKTASLSSYLARKEGADELIARMGALLHQFHPEGAGQVNEFLISINVSPNMIDRIVHCVRCIEPATIHTARTIEAKVVFDADKLQTLGPYGLVREVVYRTRKKNIDFRVAFREAEEIQKQMASLLQTATAKSIYDKIRSLSKSMFETIEEWDTLSFIDK